MIYNKTNVVGFLICILLSTFSYGMEQYNPMYQEIANLWQAAADQGYTGADLLNDVLINSLTIDPTATKAKAKLKQQQEQENIINTIRDVQMAKTKLSFSPDSDVDASANKIINAKKTISDLMNRHDDQWPNDSVPTSEWNKRIANEAIELIMGEKIHRDGVLKIINELIDQKARRKGTAYRSFGLIAATNPLKQEKITATKENIKKAIENQIEPSKTEPKEIEVEQKKEQETITTTPEITEVKEEQETELKIKPQEQTKTIVPEKVLLEKPIEQTQPIIKPTQKEIVQEITEEGPKLIEQTTTATTEKEKAQPEIEKITEKPEEKTSEPLKITTEITEEKIPQIIETKEPAEKQPETIESTIEKAIDILLKANDDKIKAAYKKDRVKDVIGAISPIINKIAEQFPDHLNLVQTLCTEKLNNYGTEIEFQESSTEFIINMLMQGIRKTYATKKTETAKAEKQAKEKLEQETERVDAQNLLKTKLDPFNKLIERAKSLNIKTNNYEDFIKKIGTENIAKKDIDIINTAFEKLAKTITTKEQEQKTTQEKKFIEEYPNRIAAEIEENRSKGIGTVVVHPNAEILINYIKDLAGKNKITIVPDTWFDITAENDAFGDDPFRFKQLTDGTIIYLKSPEDKDTSTIIVNDNLSYMLDYTLIPKIDKNLKESANWAYSGQTKKELEERITATARKHTLKVKAEQDKIKKEEQKKQEDIEFAKYQAKKKEEEDKRAAQDIQQIIKNVGATEAQAKIIFNQQKKLESQIDYFTGLVREAKKVGFDNVEQLTQMIEEIKAKKLYSIPVKGINDEIQRINKTFAELDNALEKQLRGEREVTYPEFIAKEIKENQYKGIGTVIVHKNSTELTDYIKDLAQQANVTITPNTWLDIKIGTDTFKFKQLTDGTLEYLKSPSEPNTATIANRAVIHVFDYTIVPEIKRYLQPYKEVYPEEVLADLQKRIDTAKNPVPAVKGEKEQLSQATQTYLKNITQEIESIKRKGFGTVIVHPSATNLIDYIKALAEQNGIKEIKPDTWLRINFNNDAFIFKQLSDDQKTMLYLKSPKDTNKVTTIANPNFFGDWFDNTIVPKIAEIIETQKVDTDIVQQDLQDRINKAKLAKLAEQPELAAIIPIIQPTTKEPLTPPGLMGVQKTTGPSRTAIVPTTIPIEKQVLTPEQQQPIIQPFVPIETETIVQPTKPAVKSISKQPQKRSVRGRRQTARQQRTRRTPTRRTPTRRTTTRRTPTRKRTTRSTRTKRTLKRPAQNQPVQQVETEEQNVV